MRGCKTESPHVTKLRNVKEVKVEKVYSTAVTWQSSNSWTNAAESLMFMSLRLIGTKKSSSHVPKGN